jgi:flagellar protein FlgJ
MKIGGSPAAAAVPADPAMAARDKKLRNAAQQMEGQFVEQMYKSMRDTVPTDGMFGGGSGEQMFTEMMDQHVATDTPLKWQHGLSEAIYRQMRDAVHRQHVPTVPAATGVSEALASTSSSKPVSSIGGN